MIILLSKLVTMLPFVSVVCWFLYRSFSPDSQNRLPRRYSRQRGSRRITRFLLPCSRFEGIHLLFSFSFSHSRTTSAVLDIFSDLLAFQDQAYLVILVQYPIPMTLLCPSYSWRVSHNLHRAFAVAERYLRAIAHWMHRALERCSLCACKKSLFTWDASVDATESRSATLNSRGRVLYGYNDGYSYLKRWLQVDLDSWRTFLQKFSSISSVALISRIFLSAAL